MDVKIAIKPEVKVIKPEEIVTLLEPGELGAMLDWEVRDSKTGLLMPDPRTGLPNKGSIKSKSFVQQFLQILFCQMAMSPVNSPVANVRDTTNNLRSIYGAQIAAGGANVTFDVLAAAATSTFGVVVGTGAVAPTISDYQLGAQIAHGVGVGQLQYSAVTFGAPASDATTSQVTITRNFANASGGAITVNEIGLYCRAYYSSAIGYFMIIRDVIAGGISVPNGQTLTVNYRPQAVA